MQKFLVISAAIAILVVCLLHFMRHDVMPVSTSWRSSWVGMGPVLTIENDSNRRLFYVWVNYYDGDQSQEVKYLATRELDPGSSIELGWVQGFHFVSGDTINIGARGEFPVERHVP